MPKVTVVPGDSLIIVDGERLTFSYPSLGGMHALQWDGEKGHIEWFSQPNQKLNGSDDYEAWVAGYVAAWQAEKKRVEKAEAEAEAARLAEYNSESARFARLREERDKQLVAHDALISQLTRRQRLGEDVSEQLQALDVYAVQLCNLPAQDGAPWDGGGELTPWPEQPILSKASSK